MADPTSGGAMPPDQSAAPEQDQAPQQGYCIELHVAADGSMRVNVEPEDEEASEEQAGDQGQGEEGQAVAGLKEAMQVIIDIVKNGGQVADAAAGEDDFAAGFNEDTSGNGGAPAQAKRFP